MKTWFANDGVKELKSTDLNPTKAIYNDLQCWLYHPRSKI